jgi:hypothetical protein
MMREGAKLGEWPKSFDDRGRGVRIRIQHHRYIDHPHYRRRVNAAAKRICVRGDVLSIGWACDWPDPPEPTPPCCAIESVKVSEERLRLWLSEEDVETYRLSAVRI